MTQAKHTPGPWEIEQNDRSFDVNTANNEHCICSNYGCYATLEEKLANARLIAAAPELLDALEDVVSTNWLGKGQQCRKSQNIALNKARAAIAKARGQ